MQLATRSFSIAGFTLTLLVAGGAIAGTPQMAPPDAVADPRSMAEVTAVRIPAGIAAYEIPLLGTTAPGEVEIAQYGEPEDIGSFKDAGFQVVRFDPPFVPPYTITKIAFPSLTFNGVPALFPSVRLCDADPNSGQPRLTTPLFLAAPYEGSPDGVNEIPVNLAVTDSGKIFYWCIEFPSKFAVADFPNNFPFIRMDYLDMDRGLFDNSYELTPSGRLAPLFLRRNLIVSMFCQLASPDAVPIEATSNLGANRLETKIEFSFLRPRDQRADGSPMPQNSLRQTDLLYRPGVGPWKVWKSVGAGSDVIPVDSLTGGAWTTQAVDKNGHRAVTSSVVYTAPFSTIGPFAWDADEPNGRRNQAAPLEPPVYLRRETIFPGGDQDFYSFVATPGDVIDAGAAQSGGLGFNELDLVMFLLDSSGEIVAFDDNSLGLLNPGITYVVPAASQNSKSLAPRRFWLQIADIRGSLVSPATAPRQIVTSAYVLTVGVSLPARAMGTTLIPQYVNAEGFGFQNAGPNPANPQARLLYILPRSANGVHVTLRLYDVQGRLVRSLVDRTEQPGAHVAVWDGRDARGSGVASGTYYARLTAGVFRAEQKVSILK